MAADGGLWPSSGVRGWHRAALLVAALVFIPESVAPAGTSCYGIAGYGVATGVDHYGDDIKRVPGGLREIMAACNADSHCRGFNSLGYIKDVVSPTAAKPGVCFYVKTGTSCYGLPGYTVATGVDHAGDDIKRVPGNAQQIAAACNADSRCRGFNSVGWIKDVVSPTAAQPGLCFYIKM